jgi:hypothetical protein
MKFMLESRVRGKCGRVRKQIFEVQLETVYCASADKAMGVCLYGNASDDLRQNGPPPDTDYNYMLKFMAMLKCNSAAGLLVFPKSSEKPDTMPWCSQAKHHVMSVC